LFQINVKIIELAVFTLLKRLSPARHRGYRKNTEGRFLENGHTASDFALCKCGYANARKIRFVGADKPDRAGWFTFVRQKIKNGWQMIHNHS
jgi:hypothetical protein